MTQDQIKEVIRLHGLWLNDEDGGRRADLSDAVLSGADLSGADLSGADLSGAVLSGADLSDAVLSGADLRRAVLSGADLSGADLSDADIPTIEKLHTKIRDAVNNGENLTMESWHNECGTSHCRAGWAITLAGEKGKALEDRLGSAAAGALIFAHNYPDQNIPDFYCSNETALADINRCADEEASK